MGEKKDRAETRIAFETSGKRSFEDVEGIIIDFRSVFFPALRTPCCLSAKLESLNIIDGKARSESKKKRRKRDTKQNEKNQYDFVQFCLVAIPPSHRLLFCLHINEHLHSL